MTQPAMMELDLLNEDFLLAQEWGLDVPVVQSDGQYGDLKPLGRRVDDIANLQVHGTSEDSQASTEDVLGMEWMETSDLSSFLDALGGTENLLPPEDSLLNFTNEVDQVTKQLPVGQQVEQFLLDEVKQENLASLDLIDSFTGVMVVGSTPTSSARVSPVIQLKPFDVLEQNLSSPETDLFNPETFVNRADLSFGSSESVWSPESSVLGSSPLSPDDVESILSSPGPSSPENKLDNLIEKSPELFKVITTSAAAKSKARFSPYQKSNKPKQQTTKSASKRKPAEPVPEHIILEHVNKKDRKKLQNKNAAIRYRMKKKEEANTIKSEEQELEEYNQSLKSKVDDLQREIRYMKNLMEDVYKAKGVLKI